MKREILGIQFDDLTREEAAQRGAQLLEEDKFHYVVTPNPEFILASEKDPEFKRVINEADLVLPDGIGVIYSAKILGTPLKARVAGIEFGEDMLACLNERKGRLFLLGAKPGVAEAAGEKILERYPDIVLCGTQDGYFKDEQSVLLKVAAAQPDLLFVCLGAPKQEKFIADNMDDIHSTLFCGLGGSLDVFAGVAKRAPDIFIKLGLEWFYRLLKQPSRIGRMMKLPKFLLIVIKERLFGRKGK